MDYHCESHQRPLLPSMPTTARTIGNPRTWRPPKCSLFMAVIAVAIAASVFVEPATSQHYSQQNSPPILVVPDRNWQISETEPVGKKITTIRGKDEENDELVFGLEAHFHANYANQQHDDGVDATRDKLPFRIDPLTGDVYLNESLAGRGGENFFFYITVFDGVLTAKSEIFVNILSKNGNKRLESRSQPSFSSVVQNISQFLPAFDKLPGVQSIRNQQPMRRPTQNLPPGFSPNRSGAVFNGGVDYPLGLNYNPYQQLPNWPVNNRDSSTEQHNNDIGAEDNQLITPAVVTTTTSRTRLTPVNGDNHNASMSHKRKNSMVRPSLGHNRVDETDTSAGAGAGLAADAVEGGHGDGDGNAGIAQDDSSTGLNTMAAYSFRATMIPVIITVCGLFVAAAAIFGFLYRKRLCAISKTLKKKSKEEMAKKSNQSNLSSNLTDDSRNSMVMQHWHGPMAYGNRYVPWERDQQLLQHPLATSQLSTSAANGVCHPGDAAATGMGGVGGPHSGVTGGGGVGAASGSGASGSSNQGMYDRWEFPRHRLKFFNILGEGAFGQVWRCEATDIEGLEGVTTVAVKTLKENAAEMEKKDLVSELEVMKSLEPHVNVVRLLGSCTDKEPFFVIIEYMNRGKLQTYLRNSRAERHYGNTHGKSNILTSGDLTSFMYQVAKGMDYLTSRGIIHRDLAARNILISDDHTCKVADFGFARDVVTSKIYERKSEGKLPIRWMAIESLYDNIFSVKSDIWSFGILMWEIVTLGSTPYPGISAADVMRKIRDGYRLEKPDHCRRELYNIMYYCWSQDANERPTFSELVHMLDKLLHTEMDYIELERFPDHNYYNIVSLSGEKL